MYNEKEIESAVKRAVNTLVETDVIYFTFTAEREEFIDDCIFEIMQKFDSIEDYSPNYVEEVVSMYEPDDY